MNTFKQYPKSWMILGTILFAGIMAVMGTHFADVAEKPFWWTFWQVLQIVCIIAIVGGWIYLWRTQQRDRD